MVYLAIAEGRARAAATGTNTIYSRLAWRLVVLSCVLPLSESFASESRDTKTDFRYANCEGETSLVANGVCDVSVNTANCGFDGGDCCECTCVSREGGPCDRAEAGFSCRDPEAPIDCHSAETQARILSPSITYPKCAGDIPHIKDGRCDEANNNADCGFDGGDCCASTCTSGLEFACGDGAECRDTEVTLSHRGLSSSASCGGYTFEIGNSRCDSSLNNEECGYDGGDCCECTCLPPLDDEVYAWNWCSDGDFNCLDPDANCESAVETPTPEPTPGPVYINPTPTPIYVAPVASPTGSPVPLPTTSTVIYLTPTPATTPTYSSSECGSPESYVGDGDCDASANTLECGWDGGDCCECTCVETYYYACPDFDCLDPTAPTDCGTESSLPSPSPSVTASPDPTYVQPNATPTESPAVAPLTSTASPWGSVSSPESDSLTESDDNYTGGGSETDDSGYEDDDGEEITTSSASLTASTDASVLHWEVLVALSAAVLGYCLT